MQGSYAQGRLNEFSVSKADIGKIYAITVNVNGQFADKWKVEYVTITKNEKNRVNKYSADGYYEFYINKEMSYNPTYIKPKNLPAHYDICLLGANEDYILPNATDADVSKPKTIDQEIEDGFIEVGKGVEKAAEETGNFIKSIFDF